MPNNFKFLISKVNKRKIQNLNILNKKNNISNKNYKTKEVMKLTIRIWKDFKWMIWI